jgi:hypothetical protein
VIDGCIVSAHIELKLSHRRQVGSEYGVHNLLRQRTRHLLVDVERQQELSTITPRCTQYGILNPPIQALEVEGCGIHEHQLIKWTHHLPQLLECSTPAPTSTVLMELQLRGVTDVLSKRNLWRCIHALTRGLHFLICSPGVIYIYILFKVVRPLI